MEVKKVDRKILILAIFLLIFIGLVVCFAYNAKLTKIATTGQEEKTKKISKQEMVANYKKKMSILAVEYNQAIEDYGSSSDQKQSALATVNSLKARMTEIVVPSEFKDMHLNLFLSLVSFENYLVENDLVEKKKSEKLFYIIKREYNWLNV